MPTLRHITHLIKIDRGINNINGCYFCSNMRKDLKGGMMADYALINTAIKTSSSPTAHLGTITKFVQREYGGNLTIFGKSGTTGDIFAVDKLGSQFFKAMDYSKVTGVSRGLVIDLTNEIVYVGTRYVGRTVTTTLDGAVGIGDNTIDLTDAGNFPNAGKAFIKDGLSKSEVFQWTGKSTNQLTGVTRGKENTADQTHADDREVIYFDDDWKDLGSAETSEIRPAIRVEDYVLVGNINKVAGYKETDGSDWATNLLDLPVGHKIVDFSTIFTGAGLRVIIAVNIDERGAIFIWKLGESTWDRVVELKENIEKLHKTYVCTKSGVYKTDGYTLQLVAALPEDEGDVKSADFNIYDIDSKENFLLITANPGRLNRNRTGLWILDLTDNSWYLISPSGYGVYNLAFGAVFVSSEWKIYVATGYNEGSIDLLYTQAQARANYYQFIYDPQTAKTLKLSQLKLSIDTQIKDYYNNTNFVFDIIVRAYNFKRPFLQYSQTKEASSAQNEIVISDALGVPEVGDRVEIIERTYVAYSDVAGAPRNVTAVVSGANKLTLTLDDDLPAQIDTATGEAAQMMIINPLKRVAKISVSASELDWKDYRVTAENQPEFKKLLLEIEIRCTETGISPRLNSIEITSIILET